MEAKPCCQTNTALLLSVMVDKISAFVLLRSSKHIKETLDDLRGTPVVKHDEKIGRHYFYCVTDWEEAIKNSQQESLLIFNIDEADDRLVNALKSIVERHGDKYFVGLICTDKTRKLGGTTTISLVRSIRWE